MKGTRAQGDGATTSGDGTYDYNLHRNCNQRRRKESNLYSPWDRGLVVITRLVGWSGMKRVAMMKEATFIKALISSLGRVLNCRIAPQMKSKRD